MKQKGWNSVMKKIIKNVSAIGEGTTESFKVEFPTNCPQCKTSLDINPIYACYINDEDFVPNLFVLFFCPHCEICFIVYYHFIYEGYYKDSKKVTLISFEPRNGIDSKKFPKYINELSPEFCRLYNEAYTAKQERLDGICGMGYRKALEFLVKDYAIFLNPDDKDQIIKAPLSKCINDYVDNRRIKKLAIASAWIGNDETHYERKQQEYNVDDLVAFIEAIVSFINSDISSMVAEKMIEDSKK